MSQIIQLSLTPIQAHNSENIQKAISQYLNIRILAYQEILPLIFG